MNNHATTIIQSMIICSSMIIKDIFNNKIKKIKNKIK